MDRWETQMVTYGRQHCYQGPLEHVYYDAQRVYHYRVSSKDASGNAASSVDFAFKTPITLGLAGIDDYVEGPEASGNYILALRPQLHQAGRLAPPGCSDTAL